MRRADIEAVSGQLGWYRTTVKPGWAFYVSANKDIRVGPAIKIAEHWDDRDERFVTVFHAVREGIATQDADPLPHALGEEAEIRYLQAVLDARGIPQPLVDAFTPEGFKAYTLKTLRSIVHG